MAKLENEIFNNSVKVFIIYKTENLNFLLS